MKAKTCAALTVIFMLSGCASTSVSEAVNVVSDFFGPPVQEYGPNDYYLKDTKSNTDGQRLLHNLLDKANRYCEKKGKFLHVRDSTFTTDENASLTGSFGGLRSIGKAHVSFTCE